MKTRKPVQKRSSQTVEKIKNAAKELFFSKGLQNTSSNEIAAHGGVSIGSFYSYFKDKDQLFREILEEIKDQGIITSLENLENKIDDAVEDVFRELIKDVWLSHDFSADFHRDTAMMRLKDEKTKELYHLWQQKSISLMKSYLENFEDEILVRNLDLASQIVLTTIEEFSHSLRFERLEEDPSEIIEEIVTMLCRYLFKK